MRGKKKKSCLVVHGLTGIPAIMKPVVDQLREAGYSVNSPLLPGHGTNLRDLSQRHWEEWQDAIIDAYYEEKKHSEIISCVGLSLGSLLTLNLAANERMNIRSVVAIGTPLFLGGFLEHIAYPLVRYTPIRWFYRYQKKDWEKSIQDPNGRKIYKQISYDKIPVKTVLEIFKLKSIVRRNLRNIISPVLIMHGKMDKVAPQENISILKDEIETPLTEVQLYERSKHVLTLDYDKNLVARSVVDFVERFS